MEASAMSLTDHQSSIARTAGVPYATTRGASTESLATRQEDRMAWLELIDALKDWWENPDQFEPQDRPDPAILIAAIRCAANWMESRTQAPTHALPSGSGNVAFEWESPGGLMIVEIVDPERARFTVFSGDAVASKGWWNLE